LSSDTLTHYGTITVGQTSPVVGGAMTLFGGGVMRGPGPGGPLGRTRGTVEFWVKPNSATPTATGRIITARSDDDATIVWQVSQLITTGRITFNYRKSDGAYETINFVYAPTTAAEVLVAIVLDKSTTGGSAKIYENGVLKDTQVAAYGYFASFQQGDGVPDSGAYINRTMLVGGLRSNAAAITEPFLGKIGEIVTYPYALGVDRLLSHYNARTLI
jgi:hypothetical protein